MKIKQCNKKKNEKKETQKKKKYKKNGLHLMWVYAVPNEPINSFCKHSNLFDEYNSECLW